MNFVGEEFGQILGWRQVGHAEVKTGPTGTGPERNGRPQTTSAGFGTEADRIGQSRTTED